MRSKKAGVVFKFPKIFNLERWCLNSQKTLNSEKKGCVIKNLDIDQIYLERAKKIRIPYNEKLINLARENKKAGSLSEVIFWNMVKKRQFFNLGFVRQKIIGNYIVDFYCKDLGFVVEIDGYSHDFKYEYDQERLAFLNNLGIKTLVIADVDVKKNLDGVYLNLYNFVLENYV